MWTFKIFFSEDKSKKGNKFMLIPGPSFLVLRNVQRGFYGLKKGKIKKRPWKLGIEKKQVKRKKIATCQRSGDFSLGMLDGWTKITDDTALYGVNKTMS